MAPPNAGAAPQDDDHDDLEQSKKSTSEKKSKKRGESGPDVHLTAARTIARCVDLWCEPSKMFNTMRLLQEEEMSKRGELDEDDIAKGIRQATLNEISFESREFFTRAYYKLLQLIPNLKAIVDDQTRSNELAIICSKINPEIRNTRSSDAARLKSCISRYCLPNPDDPTSLLPPIIITKTKAELGLNHPILARWLCPVDELAEYDKNPEQTRKDLASGKIQMTAEDFPALVFSRAMPGQDYDPVSDDLFSGLFRSYFLVRIARHIFLGPSYAIEAQNRKNRSSNAILNDVTTIEAEHIAYVCVQARFAISAKEMWSEEDGDLNYADMYRAIIRFIKNATDVQWKTNLLAFWNKEIFGNENGRGGSSERKAGNSAPRMSTMEKLQAKMKARLAPPPEVPMDSSSSSAAHAGPVAQPNTVAPPPEVPIDPSLLAAFRPAPVDSVAQSNTAAPPPEVPIDPALLASSRPPVERVSPRLARLNTAASPSSVEDASVPRPSYVTSTGFAPGSGASAANPTPVTPRHPVTSTPTAVSPLTDPDLPLPLTPITNRKGKQPAAGKLAKANNKRPAPPEEGEEGTAISGRAGRRTKRRK